MIKRFSIILGMLLLGVFIYLYVTNRDARDVLKHDEALDFSLHYKGKKYDLNAEEKERYLELVNEWSGSLDKVGSIEMKSYAPGVLLVSKYLRLNFHRNRTIINERDNPKGVWGQRSRKPLKVDVNLRRYLNEIIQERLAYETRFDDFK